MNSFKKSTPLTEPASTLRFCIIFQPRRALRYIHADLSSVALFRGLPTTSPSNQGQAFNPLTTNVSFICDALHDLVPFIQF